MKLTLDEIKSVTFGALDIWEQGDGVYFKRFLDCQLDAFGSLAQRFLERASATAGCRLDFHTDSRHIIVEPIQPGKYEVLVDGLQAAVIEGTKRIVLKLPEGDTRVTVLLSNHKPGALKIVYLDQGAYLKPHAYDRKFLFLGDSITQGSNSTRPSLTYVNRISHYFNAQVLNWGVGGSHFRPETLAAIDYDPDVIFIAYGTNDYVHYDSIGTIKTHCTDYMDKVQALFPGKPVYCISPIWRADGEVVRPAGTHQDVRRLIIDQCEMHGFTHIDGYELVPHMEDFYADGHLHPNDIGFCLYAENLIRHLQGQI